jgi:GAF domain-containing protein
MSSISADSLRSLQVENTRLRDENQQLKDELVRLRRTVRALVELQTGLDEITSQSDPRALIRETLASALEAVDSQDGSFLLIDEETGELVFVEVMNPLNRSLVGYRLSPGEGIAGYTAASRQAFLAPDVDKEPLFSPAADRMTGFHTHSLVAVPILHGPRTLGVIEAVNTRSGRPFDQQDVEVMTLAARLAAMALIRAEGNRSP